MHTLIVSNPGHFHAALALRNRHPLLSDEVYVYAEDGTDLERFLGLVEAFNSRAQSPTCWQLQVYRGADHLTRLIEERKGNVVLIAGKNDSKMNTIDRLQDEGFAVLCDKTWMIHGAGLPRVEKVVKAHPLALDMMTERHDVGHKILHALCHNKAVFGEFDVTADEPAIEMLSVHHLFKLVNGAPLIRPAWYFDTAVQGDGIMDVTTHLTDLSLWMTDQGQVCLPERDIVVTSAWQWPTPVPLDVFRSITKLATFPARIVHAVANDTLSYLCNARIEYRLRGVPVVAEEVWGLEEPVGGSDAFSTVLRGANATLSLVHDESTNFATVLRVYPRNHSLQFRDALGGALLALGDELPGLGMEPNDDNFLIHIPKKMMTTHEQHFAKVLDAFLVLATKDQRPEKVLADLLAKYTLLARAQAMSQLR